jgi:type I restriction enzyme S subunit
MTHVKRVRFADVGDVIPGQHIPADQYNEDRAGTPYLTGPADFAHRQPVVTKWTNHPRSFSKATDVLLTVKGAGCGKSNLGIDAAIGRQLMALRPDPTKLDRNYLFNFIRSQEQRICQLGQGATVPGIPKADIESIGIP